jgi:hypothetical protein
MAKYCRSMLDANPTLRMPAKDAAEALRSAIVKAEDALKITTISKRKKMRTL